MAWDSDGRSPLPNFRDWVPEWARVLLYAVFLVSFQFTNGMYFTAFEQMKGGMGLAGADVSMMGQTVLIGLSFYFPLAFRLKFRFPNKWNLIIAASVQILCNVIFPHLTTMPGRLVICYLGGFCRLYGTFECFSNLLGVITPTYDYGVFLSVVFFIVLGCINVFDWVQIRIIDNFGWAAMHTAAIACLLLVIVLALLFMKTVHAVGKMPLYGINWLGMVLWSIFIISLIYVFCYGSQYGWLASPRIRIALGVALFCLAYGIWAMYHLRHPFIHKEAFQMRNFWKFLGIFLILDILLSTQTVLQNTFCSAVMGMDYIALSNLKWLDFAGEGLGALFCYLALTRWKIHTRALTAIGLGCVLAYTIMMHFLISPTTPTGALALPLILCGFGHVTVFIVLTVYVQANANFTYYFEMICLLGFIRTGVGGPIGDALFEHSMTALMPYDGLFGTLRELYGFAALIGTVAVAVILLTRFKGISSSFAPRLRKIYDSVRDITDLESIKRKRKSLNKAQAEH